MMYTTTATFLFLRDCFYFDSHVVLRQSFSTFFLLSLANWQQAAEITKEFCGRRNTCQTLRVIP